MAEHWLQDGFSVSDYMMAEEVGNVVIWRTSVSKVVIPVLFHRVAMPKP